MVVDGEGREMKKERKMIEESRNGGVTWRMRCAVVKGRRKRG